MDPITITLALAGIAGAIMETNGKKEISPQWLEENFGSAAFAREFNQQLAQLQSTPYGQELFNSAYTQGQQLSNTIRANAAASGFGGPEGVQSGSSIFATSAGEGAAFNLRRQANAQLAAQADARAQAELNRKYEALAPGQTGPTTMGKWGSVIRQGAAVGMAANEARLDRKSAEAAATAAAKSADELTKLPHQTMLSRPSLFKAATPEDWANGPMANWGSYVRKRKGKSPLSILRPLGE